MRVTTAYSTHSHTHPGCEVRHGMNNYDGDGAVDRDVIHGSQRITATTPLPTRPPSIYPGSSGGGGGGGGGAESCVLSIQRQRSDIPVTT